MINVTMDGTTIRIRPVGRLDDDLATTLRELLASARAAGTEPVLDLSGLDQRDRSRAAAVLPVTPASVA